MSLALLGLRFRPWGSTDRKPNNHNNHDDITLLLLIIIIIIIIIIVMFILLLIITMIINNEHHAEIMVHRPETLGSGAQPAPGKTKSTYTTITRTYCYMYYYYYFVFAKTKLTGVQNKNLCRKNLDFAVTPSVLTPFEVVCPFPSMEEDVKRVCKRGCGTSMARGDPNPI